MNDAGGGLGYETVCLRVLNQARIYSVAVAPGVPAAARNDVDGVCYEGVDPASGSVVVGKTMVEFVPWEDLSH